MDESKKSGVDRRTFLKSAAAGASVAAATTVVAQSPEATKQEAPGGTPAKGGGKKEKKLPGDIVIERPGSDFMMDVIKTLDIEYMATNPASSFRSLQESLVNYGGNKKPELLTCTHEEAAVAIAHGYAKAAGKPMGALVAGSVGLQHAAMAIYNAWVDRVPVMIFAGNGLDATKRRPGTEWNHSVQDPGALVRDFVKWDDYPMSLQHFGESTVRAYKIAMTPPMEPVLINADIDLQEEAIHEEDLRIPKLTRSRPAQGDRAAIAEAAKWLVGAVNPVIIADRCARNQDGVKLLVELAEALQAPVVDLGGRMNFPMTHPLSHNESRRALVREADVVLLLEVADPWAQFNSLSDPHKELRYVAHKAAKIINLSMQDVFIRSNYQDHQRFMPVDLAINGDAQASLPALIDEVKRASGDDRRRAFASRGEKLKDAYVKEKRRARDEAAIGWDLAPITTARLAAETWHAVKGEQWSLAVSDRIPWARRLWPATEYHHMLGGSGAQGVGYGAPASLGVALANKSKGLFTVTFQPDGDLMYSPGILWTAAHHKIPVLFVMHNNRAYHQEIMHLQRMASLHKRSPTSAWIGNVIDNPAIDYAKLAQAQGVWGEGPVTDPGKLGAALKRAVDVVKSGQPALVDVVCQGR
ncbi:MAG: thiamine pyrophosphate-binding protein [Burkholderiales bacterium]|nr:thiamine pyrophosphate-binding protein [Burkholderiales bacterium]